MPSKIPEVKSPALAIMSVMDRAERSGKRPSIPELKKVSLHAIDYLEFRIKEVEEIEGLVSNADLDALEKRIKKLSAKEDKTDEEYVALISAERRVSDVTTRSAKSQVRAVAAQELLARETMEWGSHLLGLLAEANARDLFDELEKVLTPYLEGRPAIEAIQNVPAYNSFRYRPLWISPKETDFMRNAQSGTVATGIVYARGLIDGLKIAVNNRGIIQG